jgi:hypothetical protein
MSSSQSTAQRERGGDEVRLPLTPAMFLNETAAPGDVAHLVDEQTSSVGEAARPATRPFFAGWGAWAYPVHLALDLGAAQNVTRVVMWNESGQNEIVLSTGEPFRWTPKTVTLGGYKNWVSFPVGAKTRWLRLTLPKPVNVGEIAVYVAPPIAAAAPKTNARAAAPLARKTTPSRPPFDTFLGTNGFIDDPREKLAAVGGFLREYHSWSWDEGDNKPGYPGYPRNQNAFQPSAAAGGNAWFFDDYYADLKKRGVTVAPCVQMAPLWIVPAPHDKPVLPARTRRSGRLRRPCRPSVAVRRPLRPPKAPRSPAQTRTQPAARVRPEPAELHRKRQRERQDLGRTRGPLFAL